MKILIILILLCSCQKEIHTFENYLKIDGVISEISSVRYYESTKTINLIPENGIIVLKRKHDSIFEGYIVTNGQGFHIDSCVGKIIRNKRISGYFKGQMKLNECPASDTWKGFEIKYNLVAN